MANFLSDDEMNKIDPTPAGKHFLTDEEMNDHAPSELESATRGLAQGASFGFADEATGGLEALWEKAKGNPKKFGELYGKARDESRAAYKTAEQTNPKSYMGGQIGGAIGTALIPGLGEANLAKLGAMGAAQGLGSSEADLTKGDIAGAARDTAIGGGIGLATGGVMKGIQSLAPSANKVAGSLISGAEDIANPLSNLPGRSHSTIPGKVFGASDYAESVLGSIGNIPEKLGTGLREAGVGAAKAAETGELSHLVKSAGSLIKGGVGGLGQVGEAVMGHQVPKIPGSVGQRAIDTAIGSIATPGKAAILPIAAGSKAASNLLGLGNEAVRRGAVRLSEETVQSLAPKLGRFGQVLTEAAQRGGQSLAATHYVLQSSNPEYRQIYKDATEEEE